ncbi:DUF488 domain-containing protein [Marinococcus halophilus]|jgi:uncharacterized protein YeaO (DUF488 family)|uniref:Uroporphyrin-III C-methyltransferase n=1 Tax=Marinococcus halophilus TaxID=1371 RepID=A0A510Y7P2_MARHA|nr:MULTISPECIES: DUF488 family protein [Marinococcus]OZT79502.1 DUF488 domain-containing protein [Marinococcus halophilus]GEK59193.1 hypothetical protein MHA01_20980 [Marinococcus halophilus]
MVIQLKRIYEETEEKEGRRVLVDGVWPRGIAKDKAKVDEWARDVAPSKQLRQWFSHDPEKFDEFKEKYKQELEQNTEQAEALDQLKQTVREQNKQVTLVFAAKEETYNHARVLKEILDRQPKDS